MAQNVQHLQTAPETPVVPASPAALPATAALHLGGTIELPRMLKLLLRLAAPLQSVIDKISPTHRFINHQGVAILHRDGLRRQAAILDAYMVHFDEGCDWADMDWKNISHMYDPTSGRGLMGLPNAPQMARTYWDVASEAFQQKMLPEAFFYLGAAAHLVQDMCVPHHAAARLFAGHTDFEAYARQHRSQFAVSRRGMYGLASTPEVWVMVNARYTRATYSNCLSARLARPVLHRAVMDLLPRAQRTTAGFVVSWLTTMGVM